MTAGRPGYAPRFALDGVVRSGLDAAEDAVLTLVLASWVEHRPPPHITEVMFESGIDDAMFARHLLSKLIDKGWLARDFLTGLYRPTPKAIASITLR